MSATIQIDTTEFDRAMKEYVAASTRTLADICNRKAFAILLKAYEFTPKVSLSAIDSALNFEGYSHTVVGQKIRILKSGKIKRGKDIVEKHAMTSGKTVYRIINWRQRLGGEKGLFGSQMRTAVNDLFRKRRSSIGTLKLGWVMALKGAERVIKTFSGKKLGYPIKQPSTFLKANVGWNPVARFEYNLNILKGQFPARTPTLPHQAVSALQKAFNFEAASMREYVANKLQGVANKHNAKPGPAISLGAAGEVIR